MLSLRVFYRYFVRTLEMIKFSHSLFALPFALLGAALAFYRPDTQTLAVQWDKVFLIVCACVFARSSAMAFNRWADAEIDAENPRTSGRHIPAKLLSRSFALGFTVVCAMLFVGSAFALNTLAGMLSFPALIVLLGYSYTKRFTALSHFVLGAALSIAPTGAWIAIHAEFALIPVLISLAVLLWTAGFDLIYACQDAQVDRQQNLYSIPGRYGIPTALRLSRILYIGFVIALLFLAFMASLGGLYLTGVCIVAGLLIWEQSLIRPQDLARIQTAFFTINAWISPDLFCFTTAYLILK